MRSGPPDSDGRRHIVMNGRISRREPGTPGSARTTAGLLAAGLLGAALGGCGHPRSTPGPPSPAIASSPAAAAAPSSAPAPGGSLPPVPEPEASTTVHVRRIGPGDAGHDVTVRVGDLAQVVPAARSGGWRLVEYPKAILRPQGSTGRADGFAFLAVAVGEGDVVLAPAGGGDSFVVHVRILRDLIQPPPA